MACRRAKNSDTPEAAFRYVHYVVGELIADLEMSEGVRTEIALLAECWQQELERPTLPLQDNEPKYADAAK